MNPDLFDLLKSKALFEHLPEPLRELWNRSMVVLEEAMDTRAMTAEEAAQAPMVGEAPKSAEIVAEIPKFPHMPRPKKDKQHMVPVRVSPRNLLRTRLTMEEKGKAINLEADKEEEDFQEILVEEEEVVEMEVET